MCLVEPLGRLGWKLMRSCCKKQKLSAHEISCYFFYRRVILSWFFLQKINRQIPHVHQFISEFLELHKYSRVTDYDRFCFLCVVCLFWRIYIFYSPHDMCFAWSVILFYFVLLAVWIISEDLKFLNVRESSHSCTIIRILYVLYLYLLE